MLEDALYSSKKLSVLHRVLLTQKLASPSRQGNLSVENAPQIGWWGTFLMTDVGGPISLCIVPPLGCGPAYYQNASKP